MINKENFIGYLSNPASLNEESQSEIIFLANQFPYCHSLQILKLLNFQITADLQYPLQLKIAAINAPNRFILKKHVEAIERYIRNDDTLYISQPEQSGPTFESSEELTPSGEIEQSQDLTNPLTTEPPDFPVIVLPEIDTPYEVKQKPIETASHIIVDPVKKNEIVDHFLTHLPGVIRSKGDFFNPVDFARHSNLDNESIVTETLAVIYEKQGHFSKAIKIYEILMLRIPEKSSYFAAQIEKIKQVANNQSKA